MNTVDILYYICLIVPLAMLAWLCIRPMGRASRSALVVFGLAVYGFVVKAVVAPVTSIYTAHVYAVQQMPSMGYDSASVSVGLLAQVIGVLGISLVAVILLLLWLQRLLARVPERTLSVDTSRLAER